MALVMTDTRINDMLTAILEVADYKEFGTEAFKEELREYMNSYSEVIYYQEAMEIIENNHNMVVDNGQSFAINDLHDHVYALAQAINDDLYYQAMDQAFEIVETAIQDFLGFVNENLSDEAVESDIRLVSSIIHGWAQHSLEIEINDILIYVWRGRNKLDGDVTAAIGDVRRGQVYLEFSMS